MLQCATVYPYLSHLPSKPATYILSVAGCVRYVGISNNLQRRMQHHKSENQKVEFTKATLLHWFPVRDQGLEMELQRHLRPSLGKISIYQSLDALPLIFRDYFLKRINREIDAIPDDFADCPPYFERIAAYWKLIAHNCPSEYNRTKWKEAESKVGLMRDLAKVC